MIGPDAALSEHRGAVTAKLFVPTKCFRSERSRGKGNIAAGAGAEIVRSGTGASTRASRGRGGKGRAEHRSRDSASDGTFVLPRGGMLVGATYC